MKIPDTIKPACSDLSQHDEWPQPQPTGVQQLYKPLKNPVNARRAPGADFLPASADLKVKAAVAQLDFAARTNFAWLGKFGPHDFRDMAAIARAYDRPDLAEAFERFGGGL